MTMNESAFDDSASSTDEESEENRKSAEATAKDSDDSAHDDGTNDLDFSNVKFYEGDKAMYTPDPEADGEGGLAVKVRILAVQPPNFLVALPDGTEASVPSGHLLALEEFESLRLHREAKDQGVVTTETYGGRGGGQFDAFLPPAGGHVVEIGVKNGALIDGLAVMFSDSSESRFGGDGGGEARFALGGGEFITEVEVRYGRFVQGLTFWTNKGQKMGPCGAKGFFLGLGRVQVVRLMAPRRYMLAGVHGRCGKFIDSIGFHWAPVTSGAEMVSEAKVRTCLQKQLLSSTECFGGSGGAAFDDGHFNIRVTNVSFWTGSNNTVKTISVKYLNGKIVVYGHKPKSTYKESSLILEKGEHIDQVSIRHGQFVYGLTFRTSNGRQIECAGTNTGKDSYVKDSVVKAPDGNMLIGIKGRSDARLNSIGFHWAPAPKE